MRRARWIALQWCIRQPTAQLGYCSAGAPHLEGRHARGEQQGADGDAIPHPHKAGARVDCGFRDGPDPRSIVHHLLAEHLDVADEALAGLRLERQQAVYCVLRLLVARF